MFNNLAPSSLKKVDLSKNKQKQTKIKILH